jgi:hypothetical protein
MAVRQWALSFVFFLGVAEALVRGLSPTPRAQVLVESRTITFGETGGVVTWHTRDPQIEPTPCASSAASHQAVVVGSSILRGSGTEGPNVFSELLRQRLDPAAWCVDNLSQPAFSSEQKRAVALEALARPRPPDRLYWEVWQNDGGHYVRLGDTVINVGAYPLDEAGYPSPLGLPPAVNRGLFDHVALWRYAVLALGARDPASQDPKARWEAILRDDLLPVVEAAKAVGTQIVLIECPPLDRPFADSVVKPHRGFGAVWTFAGAQGLRWIRLESALEGEDYVALRADPCCHYNAAGHARLADIFERDLVGDVVPEKQP